MTNVNNKYGDSVFRKIAEKYQNDTAQAISYQDILRETDMKASELQRILIYLNNEGLITTRTKVLNDTDVISITQKGIRTIQDQR